MRKGILQSYAVDRLLVVATYTACRVMSMGCRIAYHLPLAGNGPGRSTTIGPLKRLILD